MEEATDRIACVVVFRLWAFWEKIMKSEGKG